MKKWHLWLAASIGLVVIAGMMIREFDVDALSSIDLSPGFFLGVGMAVELFALQNLMLSLRTTWGEPFSFWAVYLMTSQKAENLYNGENSLTSWNVRVS